MLVNGNATDANDGNVSMGVAVIETVGPATDAETPNISATTVAPALPPAGATVSAPTPAPGLTTWQGHPIDIDVIQRKLVKHKYFTPADFLHDISLIEENASRVGDGDRQSRIAEMAANARLHVSGFDPKWTPEFEAYKERMRVRKAERQRMKEREREKEKETDCTGEAGANGPIVAGEVVAATNGGTVVTGAVRVITTDAGLKRSRDDEGMERDRKRLREDVPAVETAVVGTTIGTDALTSAPPALNDPPTETPGVPPYLPLVVHPPFVLPTLQLVELASALRHDTEGLNVEELEQLRAACYDRIWRERGEWDRTELVAGLKEFVEGYVREARVRREAVREEQER
jgi:hypothetical protein